MLPRTLQFNPSSRRTGYRCTGSYAESLPPLTRRRPHIRAHCRTLPTVHPTNRASGCKLSEGFVLLPPTPRRLAAWRGGRLWPVLSGVELEAFESRKCGRSECWDHMAENIRASGTTLDENETTLSDNGPITSARNHISREQLQCPPSRNRSHAKIRVAPPKYEFVGLRLSIIGGWHGLAATSA